jgi:hypothetical protein
LIGLSQGVLFRQLLSVPDIQGQRHPTGAFAPDSILGVNVQPDVAAGSVDLVF